MLLLSLHLVFCRLDQYLEYVVTYTDDTAYIQAAKADRLFSEVGHNDYTYGMSCLTVLALEWYHQTSQILKFQLLLRSSGTLQGVDQGPLQGIPYGLKDLISVKGYRTTWGAPAYMEQMLDTDAYVYKRCGALLPLSLRCPLLLILMTHNSCSIMLGGHPWGLWMLRQLNCIESFFLTFNRPSYSAAPKPVSGMA